MENKFGKLYQRSKKKNHILVKVMKELERKRRKINI